MKAKIIIFILCFAAVAGGWTNTIDVINHRIMIVNNVIAFSGGEDPWAGFNFDSAPFPSPSDGCFQVGRVLNNELYRVGGTDASNKGVTNAYKYDGTNWIKIAALPTPMFIPKGCVFQNKLFVCGGQQAIWSVSTNFYGFDGTNWAYEPAYPVARFGAALASYQNRLFGIGGSTGGSESTNVFRFDGTNWTQVAGLPVSSHFGCAMAYGDYLYYHGTAGEYWTPVTNVFRFDGTNWTQVAGLPAARMQSTMCVAHDKLLLIGGAPNYGTMDRTTNVFIFDGVSWIETNGVPEAGHTAGDADIYNGKIVIQQGVWGDSGGTNVWTSD
jgi:N-acetylneuraminic acid mutarotase